MPYTTPPTTTMVCRHEDLPGGHGIQAKLRQLTMQSAMRPHGPAASLTDHDAPTRPQAAGADLFTSVRTWLLGRRRHPPSGRTNFKMLGRVLVYAAVAASAVASAYVEFVVSEGGDLSLAGAIFLGFPIVVAALPLLAPSGGPAVVLRGSAAVILFAWNVFLFALFYMPAAALMLLAAVMADQGIPPANRPGGGQD